MIIYSQAVKVVFYGAQKECQEAYTYDKVNKCENTSPEEFHQKLLNKS